MDAMLNSLLN